MPSDQPANAVVCLNIELTVGDRARVLTRELTASGARYSGNGLEFWNKGDEALLTIGEEQFTCKRR